MKKVLYFVMCLCTLSFVACDKDDDPKDNPTPSSKFSINITVSDITASGASVDLVPSNDTTYYYYDVWTKEEYDAWNGNLDSINAYYDEYFAYVISYYAQYGYTYTVADFMSQGEDGYDFTGLDPETSYVAIAMAWDGTKFVGTVYTKEFTTPAVVMSDMTISYVKGDTALYIVPSDTTASYFCTMYATDTLTSYGYTIQTYAPAAFDYYSQYYGSYFEYYYCYTGVIYVPYSSMTEQTDFAACGVDGTNKNTDWFFYTYNPSAAAGVAAHKSHLAQGYKDLVAKEAMMRNAKRATLKK